MVKNPLADPCDSVEHAKGHIEEIESLARLFLESRPYTIIAKPDPLYPTHQIMYAKLAKPIPVRIHGLALDAVKNLRGALDQLGFAVAVAAGKSGKNAHFPFGEKPEDLEAVENIAPKISTRKSLT